MKQLITLSICLLLLISAGCHKEKTSANGAVPVSSESDARMNYNIIGWNAASLKIRTSKSFSIDVAYSGGAKEQVELSFVDLPSNIGITLQPSIGIPPFKTEVTIISKDTTTGKFPLLLLAKQSSGAEKRLESPIILYNTCVNHMSGAYRAQF
ncbi:MAG: hypothetical protein EOP56_13450 [Sphingobacteriales bacterium]|nr:MAG: hypothetical protein EOP56_13450 [Sphingobacteriales bacterium]